VSGSSQSEVSENRKVRGTEAGGGCGLKFLKRLKEEEGGKVLRTVGAASSMNAKKQRKGTSPQDAQQERGDGIAEAIRTSSVVEGQTDDSRKVVLQAILTEIGKGRKV